MKKYVIINNTDRVIDGKVYYEVVTECDTLNQAYAINIKKGISETTILKKIEEITLTEQ